MVHSTQFPCNNPSNEIDRSHAAKHNKIEFRHFDLLVQNFCDYKALTSWCIALNSKYGLNAGWLVETTHPEGKVRKGP